MEGDAGAPLEEEEIGILGDSLEHIRPFMLQEGREVVDKTGVFDYDTDGDFVTPLINGRDCAFICYDGSTAYCAIEKAFEAGLIDFPKPVSCHLYPIRLGKAGDRTTVNYHQWHICETALIKGKNESVLLYRFLKSPLIRRFGKEWYDELCRQIEKK